MKRFRKPIIVAAITVACLFLLLYLGDRTATPVSTLILKERDKFAQSLEEERSAMGMVALAGAAEKLEVLDYRLAMAYNAENKPDKAIAVIERLIRDEEARGAGGGTRSSRSYLRESRYYEVLTDAYELKRDDVAAMSAKHKRIEMLSKAEDVKRQEALKEGKFVGRGRE